MYHLLLLQLVLHRYRCLVTHGTKAPLVAERIAIPSSGRLWPVPGSQSSEDIGPDMIMAGCQSEV